MLKEINAEYSLEGLMAKAETPILWPPDAKSRLIRKDPDAGKDWGWEKKRMTEDEMVGWHHRFNGHEFEKILGDSGGQGSLACCSPWSHKVKYNLVTEQLKVCIFWSPSPLLPTSHQEFFKLIFLLREQYFFLNSWESLCWSYYIFWHTPSACTSSLPPVKSLVIVTTQHIRSYLCSTYHQEQSPCCHLISERFSSRNYPEGVQPEVTSGINYLNLDFKKEKKKKKKTEPEINTWVQFI